MTPERTEELAARLAVCGPDDRVRGAMFNAILQQVETRLGADARATVRARMEGTAALRDLSSYPASDFLKVLFGAAELLSEAGGSFEEALQACGEADVLAFARSSIGTLFFGLISLASAARVVAQAPGGYASLVTYGQRRWEQQGEAAGVLHMEGDMQPPGYHVGVIIAGLRSVGYAAEVRATARALTACDYAISWTKA